MKNSTIVQSFSFNTSQQSVLEQAKELSKMEGKSLSQLVISLLMDYVKIHVRGNPQTRMQTWIDSPEVKAWPVVGQSSSFYLDYVSKQPKTELDELQRCLQVYLNCVRHYTGG